MFRSFLDFILPHRCIFCHDVIYGNEVVCGACMLDLPWINHDDFFDNDLARIFWKRLPLVRASAMFYYRTSNETTLLVTGPKFGRRDDIAYALGQMAADHFLSRDFFDGIDIVIPMPTTAKRYRKRGMNTAEVMADGLVSRIPGIRLVNDVAVRTDNQESQIHHTLRQRIETITPSVFEIRHAERLKAKHILLLDDVITTGTTVASLGTAIVSAEPDVRISVLGMMSTSK